MLGRGESSAGAYREVFDGIDEGLVLLEGDTGRIVDVNGSFADLVGAARESLAGRTLVSITNNESHAAVAYAIAMIERAAAGEPQSFEWTDRNAAGETVELDVDLSPVTVDGDRLVLGVVHDVTTDRERERALFRRKERLEEFAGVVSHDLRGPLNVVEGELHRYRETGAAEHLDAVEAAACHLDRVVADLLDLAKDGRTVGEMEPVSLEAMARRAWSLVDDRGATLLVTGDSTVRADPGRLTRALENLFRNAVEHGSTSLPSQAREDSVEHGSTCSRPEADDVAEGTSAGNQRPPGADDAVEHGSTSPPSQAREDSVEHGSTSRREPTVGSIEGRPRADELGIRVGPLADGEGFFVADDGPGIPADERERAFAPGFTTAADGTGLGLAIVRRIFEAHGWSTEVTESEDGGARFVVRGVTLGVRAESCESL
ncbi:HAMP domain-containing sensor histidine kinase [Salinirubellus sp. GCM10025818]|uniref:HAMP domain-containing sensor histidine kinase n=1 Tax=Salinirubellus TaxID=2162630 RepID=UPI0030D43DC8